MTKTLQTIADLTPDEHNANKGTVRGRAMIEQSIRECGAGRSIVVDREGRVIGGNKTLDVIEELGIPVQIVPTDGKTLVVVQRTDLDLESDPRARRLAYLDNRTTDVDLEWDAEAIAAGCAAGHSLGADHIQGCRHGVESTSHIPGERASTDQAGRVGAKVTKG